MKRDNSTMKRCDIVRASTGTIVRVVVASLALALGACEAENPMLVTPPPPTPAKGEEGTTGESLYRFHCAGCHGNDGRPLVQASEDLRDWEHPFATFDSVLTDGPGLMPRYPHLAPAQRQLVYDHIIRFSR